MYCSNCGSKTQPGASFCANCGQQLPAANHQHVQPAQPVNQYVQPAQPANPYVQPQQPVKKKKSGVWIGVLAFVLVLAVAVPIILITSYIAGRRPDPTTATQPGLTTATTDVTSPTAADGFREQYTTILGDGQDTCTIMIYMVGSDLESQSGAATLDLEEMLAAEIGPNVNVIVETGGCHYWQNSTMTDGEVQRWSVENGTLVNLQNLGQKSMLTPQALSDFIDYSVSEFPANRYSLVLWDHGGGSLYGFGSDEVYPDDCLFLPDIADALAYSDVKFDFVGFDACLMGSIETAYMLEPYADYLVASEENEPAWGWDYSVWLEAIGQDPSLGTVELGRVIVDSFIDQNSPTYTLSVVALREIPYVYDLLCTMMASASNDLANLEFNEISEAISDTKTFSEGRRDMYDLIDFTNQCDLDGEAELVAAVESCVKYRNDCWVSGTYGLSLYFPYTDLTVYGYARDMFSYFGFGGQVYDFYDSFVNILAGGQRNSDSQSLQEYFTGEDSTSSDYSQYAWYDEDVSEDYDYESIEYTELEIFWDDENEYYYLPMTDEDWNLITEVQMQVLLDDGDGYIDLGLDQYFETDSYDNLILNYGMDNTWIAIDGQIVCYYAESITETEQGTTYTGYVPAVLNETTDIEIILIYDDVNPQGRIAGYRLAYSNSPFGGEGTEGKGYLPLQQGDMIEFICDFYTYDGEFDASYYFGSPIYIGSQLPIVSYEDVGADPVLQCYLLIDIYQNYAWTETVIFE